MNLFQDESEEELSSIKEKIDKFSAIDNTSYKFRYPIDTTGKPNYPIDQDIAISFIALRDIMRDLDLYLSGTAECIYDMPGHGYFLPGQPKMSEEQIADLLTFIKDSGKLWELDEIPTLINEGFDLAPIRRALNSCVNIFNLYGCF